MFIQVTKRILFFVVCMLILMMWAAPSVAQIIESQGYASWYNRGAHGTETASGEAYDHSALTAAHPFLPFDSMVRVTRLDTGRSVVVRINDRMEIGPGHIIDLSGAAASKLGLLDVNVARVQLDLERPVDLLRLQERLASQYRQESASEKSIPDVASYQEPASETNVIAQRDVVPVADLPRTQKYTLQLGVFSSQPAAIAFAADFENGWITEVGNSGESMYRVYFDRFSQEQPARSAQRQLKENGHDSFLREIL